MKVYMSYYNKYLKYKLKYLELSGKLNKVGGMFHYPEPRTPESRTPEPRTPESRTPEPRTPGTPEMSQLPQQTSDQKLFDGDRLNNWKNVSPTRQQFSQSCGPASIQFILKILENPICFYQSDGLKNTYDLIELLERAGYSPGYFYTIDGKNISDKYSYDESPSPLPQKKIKLFVRPVPIMQERDDKEYNIKLTDYNDVNSSVTALLDKVDDNCPMICSITHPRIYGHWIVLLARDETTYTIYEPYEGAVIKLEKSSLLDVIKGDPQHIIVLCPNKFKRT
jgi:hypothetical protein